MNPTTQWLRMMKWLQCEYQSPASRVNGKTIGAGWMKGAYICRCRMGYYTASHHQSGFNGTLVEGENHLQPPTSFYPSQWRDKSVNGNEIAFSIPCGSIISPFELSLSLSPLIFFNPKFQIHIAIQNSWRIFRTVILVEIQENLVEFGKKIFEKKLVFGKLVEELSIFYSTRNHPSKYSVTNSESHCTVSSQVSIYILVWENNFQEFIDELTRLNLHPRLNTTGIPTEIWVNSNSFRQV